MISVLTFIVNVLNIQNTPFVLRTHMRHQAPKGLVLHFATCVCDWGSLFLFSLSLFSTNPTLNTHSLCKEPKTQLIFEIASQKLEIGCLSNLSESQCIFCGTPKIVLGKQEKSRLTQKRKIRHAREYAYDRNRRPTL